MNEESIFAAALEKTPADRAAFLDGVCAADPALRAKVASLLQAHEEAGGFLEPGASRQVTRDQPRMLERPGAMVGPYKLMEEIGEGGFGIVFVAEQQQPLRRKVALKLIKPGMDTKQVIARFEAERQALAMMEHPNIAKVLDAGTTDSGHPYFAMELVKGIAITEYCDRNRLTIDERLALFIQVCRAIQHAHQKGIIHRDIKPSNVLVTLHDGQPVPKVIDFGVAKAINARLTDKTIYTQHLQVIGTLLYMSPEQAELSGLDIDTRSDIYALGVLLYELLTGTTPFQDADLRRAGFDEQRRIIREQEPPRLSVRISSLRETATAVAEQRKTDAKRLHQQVRGDLDWMVLKALEKDRTRRYGTAADFAQDIERHLANEPVVACPPSLMYRVRKYWRRNHLALSVVIFVVTLLGIGVSITLWKTYESMKHLQAFRDLAFQRTMNAAILGDREFLEGFMQAEDVNIAEEWRHFFHGLVCYYDGRMNEAVSDFKRSLEIEENNMAACAMLVLSFLATFDWDEYFAWRGRLESMSPREDFREYDRFFYSLHHIYSGSDDAGLAIRAFLEEHPNSAMARLCDTTACYATAQMQGDLDLARTNVDRNVVVIEELLGDTPLAQVVCLMAYAIFIQLAEEANESTAAVRARCDGLLARMHTEEYGQMHFARAFYYDVVGRYEDAWRSWEAVAKTGLGDANYIVEGIRLGRSQAVADFLRNCTKTQQGTKVKCSDWWIEPGDKRDRVIQSAESDGFDVVLYVGDERTGEAIPGTKADESVYVKLSFTHVYPARIRQFLQRTIGETELIADAGTSRADLARAYYAIGLDHMANGRYAAARENLARVVDLHQNWLPSHCVARLLCERIGDQ